MEMGRRESAILFRCDVVHRDRWPPIHRHKFQAKYYQALPESKLGVFAAFARLYLFSALLLPTKPTLRMMEAGLVGISEHRHYFTQLPLCCSAVGVCELRCYPFEMTF